MYKRQVRKEYTNWVWSDGNHPSIVIWDAINENWDSYIAVSYTHLDVYKRQGVGTQPFLHPQVLVEIGDDFLGQFLVSHVGALLPVSYTHL